MGGERGGWGRGARDRQPCHRRSPRTAWRSYQVIHLASLLTTVVFTSEGAGRFGECVIVGGKKVVFVLRLKGVPATVASSAPQQRCGSRVAWDLQHTRSLPQNVYHAIYILTNGLTRPHYPPSHHFARFVASKISTAPLIASAWDGIACCTTCEVSHWAVASGINPALPHTPWRV